MKRPKTLKTFVCGKGNVRAWDIACKIARGELDAKSYPVTFVGKHGIGKSHLLHAIVAEIHQREPGARVRVISGEELISEFAKGVKRGLVDRVLKKYSDVDVFVLDDLDFLGRGNVILAGLREILLKLQAKGARIVLGLSSPPARIKGMKEVLFDRLPGGMVVPMKMVDQETREKIVRQFAADVGLKLKPEVVHFMASCRCDTISGLRGYVLRLKMASFIQRRPASLSLAKRFCSG